MGATDHRRNLYVGADNETPRRCTDISCLCAFILFFIAMVVVGVLGFMHGNPYKLIYATDLNGQTCGENGFGQNIWYPPEALATGSTSLWGFCVASCPEAGAIIDHNNKYVNPAPPATNAPPGQKTEASFFRCLYTGDFAKQTAFLETDLHSVHAQVSRALAGLREFAIELFVVGFGASAFLSLVYIALLGCCGGCLVWGTLLLVLLLLAASAAVSGCMAGYYDLGGMVSEATGSVEFATYNCVPGDFKTGFTVMFYVFCAMTLVHLCMVCCLCSRINMGLKIIKAAGKAVLGMWCSLFLFLLVPVLLYVGYTAYWVYSMGYIYTSTTSALNGTVNDALDSVDLGAVENHVVVTNDTIQNAMWVYLFWFYWTIEMIMAFAAIVVAGAVGSWYWAGGRLDGDKTQNSGEVGRGFYNALRYHLGTIALGSAIIAVVRFVRAVLAYIQKKTQGSDSKILKAIFCIFQCCLWCLEKCLKFINKNAYVITAVQGKGFCKAAADAFQLLATNIVRVGTISYMSTFVLLLGKMAVSFICLLIGFLWVNRKVTLDLKELSAAANDTSVDTFFVYMLMFFLSYATAYIIIETYDMAIDTILMCVLLDEEANCNVAGPHSEKYYADPEITKYLDDSEEHAFPDHKKAQASPISPNNALGKRATPMGDSIETV